MHFVPFGALLPSVVLVPLHITLQSVFAIRPPSVFVAQKIVSLSALLLQARKSRVHTASIIAAEVMVGPWGFVSGSVHLWYPSVALVPTGNLVAMSF